MAKAVRDLKVRLELTEEEACDVYIHLKEKYLPNNCSTIKHVIKEALGYEPKEAPSL